LFECKENNCGRYEVLAQAPFAPPELSHGNVQVNQRGCRIGDHGKGKGTFIPFTVSRGYREIGLKCFRDFIEEIFNEGGVTEHVSVKIAEQVETTVNWSEPRTGIHLINMSGACRQNFGQHLPIPIGNMKLSSEGICKFKASASVSNQVLEVKDGMIKLPKMDLYEVIVIENIQRL